ncbi:HipA domain-containing protein [Olsenella uli]|uniref:HipA domain-containing protein n=1 Tax=Olsenella uli TaxID=133926 RepID=UPI00195C3CF6|nr:HipA domain-containing protein [Olsenella uli]MBM6675519.1 HipA domain-containing protein [Olsenella uli]
MPAHLVYRLDRAIPVLVGTLGESGESFSYDAGYLAKPGATPLSLSLPLREGRFDGTELRPYFEGLLAEGRARAALAAELGLAEEDWVGMLVACGRECVGDVLVLDRPPELPLDVGEYETLDEGALRGMFLDDPSVARENVVTRLSLAGTQLKTALAWDGEATGGGRWLRPVGLSASTHILKASHLRDLPEIEFLCMSSARRCGLDVVDVRLLGFGNPVLAVERFDRLVSRTAGGMAISRVHQEDMAQALGVTGGSKYAELGGGSIRVMAELLRRRGTRPAGDVARLAQTVCLNYLVGNCDAHLKNFSMLHDGPDRGGGALVSLAPAYDIVSTTCFPKHPRRLAMRVGDARTIDEVTPASFRVLAADLGIRDAALRRLASPLVEGLVGGVRGAAEGAFGDVLESTPYVAEDLIEDMAPRVRILSEYCLGRDA